MFTCGKWRKNTTKILIQVALISLDNDGIKSFFNDEFLKEIGMGTPSRTELDWRNEITYGATKFEELYWGVKMSFTALVG